MKICEEITPTNFLCQIKRNEIARLVLLGNPDKNPPLFQWGDELEIKLYVSTHKPNIIDARLY